MDEDDYLLFHDKADEAGIGALLDAVSDGDDAKIAQAVTDAVSAAVMNAVRREAICGRYYERGQIALALSALAIDNMNSFLDVERDHLRDIACYFQIPEAALMADMLVRAAIAKGESNTSILEIVGSWHDWQEVEYYG